VEAREKEKLKKIEEEFEKEQAEEQGDQDMDACLIPFVI
jgi:hypothetical protein